MGGIFDPFARPLHFGARDQRHPVRHIVAATGIALGVPVRAISLFRTASIRIGGILGGIIGLFRFWVQNKTVARVTKRQQMNGLGG